VRGTAPSSDSTPIGEEDTPSPYPRPIEEGDTLAPNPTPSAPAGACRPLETGAFGPLFQNPGSAL